MKQALSALLFSLLLACSKAQAPTPPIICHAYQLLVQLPGGGGYVQNVAVELTLEMEDQNCLTLELHNLRTGAINRFTATENMAPVQDGEDSVHRYTVREESHGLKGVLYLRYRRDRLALVTLGGEDYLVALTIFYPLYRKV